jgi:nucleotide-binding universal stress UspA family protein
MSSALFLIEGERCLPWGWIVFKHILVPLDGSSIAECVLPHIVAVARAFEANVTVLQVVEQAPVTGPLRSVDPLSWNIVKSEAEAYLKGIVQRLNEIKLQVDSTLLEGNAAESVIQFAQDNKVDLIILSSHGRSGLSGWNVSSVVQKILLRSYLPTMIIRAYHPTTMALTGLRYKRILIPLDCSQRAECVLPIVTSLADFHDPQLLFVHVVRRPDFPQRTPPIQADLDMADQIIQRLRETASEYLSQLQPKMISSAFDVRTCMTVSENVAATLHAMADTEDVDLVVLSAHGQSFVPNWPFGGATINFIAYGTTPLLIVQDVPPDQAILSNAEVAATEHEGH